MCSFKLGVSTTKGEENRCWVRQIVSLPKCWAQDKHNKRSVIIVIKSKRLPCGLVY